MLLDTKNGLNEINYVAWAHDHLFILREEFLGPRAPERFLNIRISSYEASWC